MPYQDIMRLLSDAHLRNNKHNQCSAVECTKLCRSVTRHGSHSHDAHSEPLDSEVQLCRGHQHIQVSAIVKCNARVSLEQYTKSRPFPAVFVD